MIYWVVNEDKVPDIDSARQQYQSVYGNKHSSEAMEQWHNGRR